MGRRPINPRRAAAIEQNCERIATMTNEIQTLRKQNQELEWQDHCERRGSVGCL